MFVAAAAGTPVAVVVVDGVGVGGGGETDDAMTVARLAARGIAVVAAAAVAGYAAAWGDSGSFADPPSPVVGGCPWKGSVVESRSCCRAFC